MQKIKFLFLSFLWITLTHNTNACEERTDDLFLKCSAIASGNSSHPGYSPEILKQYLPKRFMEKVMLVGQDQQNTLISLVLPWINDTIDKQEVALRYALVSLTEKLAHIPANERESVMSSLNKIASLAVPTNNAQKEDLTANKDALKMVRLKLIGSINLVDPNELNTLLSSALPTLESVSPNTILEKLSEALNQ